MPLAVRGYQLRDSVRLGSDAAGVQYMYTRNKTDDIAVFVAPYRPDDKLGSADERSDYVLSDVDAYYQTLELAARQGNLEGFRLLHRGSDDLHTHGHSVIAAAVWAIFARRGATRPVFTYYATYALPTEAIRIRAELPLITAGTEGVPEFARTLIASLAAQY